MPRDPDCIEIIAESTRHHLRAALNYDPDPTNPRTDDDHPGTRMICFHRRYSLGDKHPYASVESFFISLMRECSDASIRQLARELHSELNEYLRDSDRFTYEAIDDMAPDELRDLLETVIDSSTRRTHELIAREWPGIILPLYLYDHSGLTMSTGAFSCRWDSGQVGWIICSFVDALCEIGYPDDSTLTKRITALLEAEVQQYDAYLQGQCYGYVIEDTDTGETLDSCWDFLGDEDECRAQALIEFNAIIRERRIALRNSILAARFAAAPSPAD